MGDCCLDLDPDLDYEFGSHGRAQNVLDISCRRYKYFDSSPYRDPDFTITAEIAEEPTKYVEKKHNVSQEVVCDRRPNVEDSILCVRSCASDFDVSMCSLLPLLVLYR